MQKHVVNKKAASNTVAMVMGLVTIVVTIFLSAILFAVCVDNEFFKLETSIVGAGLVHFVATLLCAIVITSMAPDNKVLFVLLCTGLLVLIEFGVNMLIFKGVTGTFALNAMCTIAGVITNGFVMVKIRKQNKCLKI